MLSATIRMFQRGYASGNSPGRDLLDGVDPDTDDREPAGPSCATEQGEAGDDEQGAPEERDPAPRGHVQEGNPLGVATMYSSLKTATSPGAYRSHRRSTSTKPAKTIQPPHESPVMPSVAPFEQTIA